MRACSGAQSSSEVLKRALDADLRRGGVSLFSIIVICYTILLSGITSRVVIYLLTVPTHVHRTGGEVRRGLGSHAAMMMMSFVPIGPGRGSAQGPFLVFNLGSLGLRRSRASLLRRWAMLRSRRNYSCFRPFIAPNGRGASRRARTVCVCDPRR